MNDLPISYMPMSNEDSERRDLKPGRVQARLNFSRSTGNQLLRLAVDEHKGLFLCREFSIGSYRDGLTQHQLGRWRTLSDTRHWLTSRYAEYLQAGWNLIFMYQAREASLDLLEGPWLGTVTQVAGKTTKPFPRIGVASGEITIYDNLAQGNHVVRTVRPHDDRTDHTFESMRFADCRESADFLVSQLVDCWEDLEARELLTALTVGTISGTPILKAFPEA